MYRGERFNGFSHLAGVIAAVVGAVLLTLQVWPQGDPWVRFSVLVYGLSLMALYSFSTLYHSSRGPVKALFRQLDHLAIYLLIAGTYSPFLMKSLRHGDGPWMFVLIWALAAVGMVLEMVPKANRRLWAILIYLLMGWVSLLVIRPLAEALPPEGLHLLLGGGLAYTGGVVFYVFDKKVRHFHGIWHLFVLAGSVSHFLCIYLYVF